jgi:hypothetical protein
VAGSIFLYLGPPTAARFRWAVFAFFGCFLSLSSGPLLAFALVACFFAYDRLLESFTVRWKVASLALVLFLLAVFASSERPISWLVAHLTLDPGTAYFRLYVFDYVIEHIKMKPLLGYGFGPIGSDPFLSTTTVDSVWLVNSARYGIPMIVLFFLANLMAFVGSQPRGQHDDFMRKAGTGFSQALVTFILVGITVHFWNSTWMFWAVCLGIRASIKEWNHASERLVVRHRDVGARAPNFGPPVAKKGLIGVTTRFSRL